MSQSCIDLLGDLPHPEAHDEVRAYMRSLLSHREMSPLEVFDGATTYYVSNAGSDANNGTSTATPFATWSPVADRMDDNANPIRVLHRCGDIFLENIDRNITKPVWLDCYGSGAKPILSQGTVSISGASGWTNAGGGVYTIDLDTAHGGALLGQLIIVGNAANKDGFSKWRWPLQHCTSAALAAATAFSWFEDASTKVLTVNIGTLTMTDLTFRASKTTDTARHGVRVLAGSDNVIVKNLAFELNGNHGGTGNDGWGVISLQTGGESCLIADCEGCYHERHCFGVGDAGSGQHGPIFTVVRTMTAFTQLYSQPNVIYAPNAFDQGEFVIANCWFPGGNVLMDGPGTHASHMPYSCHGNATGRLFSAWGHNFENLAEPVVSRCSSIGFWAIEAADQDEWKYNAYIFDIVGRFPWQSFGDRKIPGQYTAMFGIDVEMRAYTTQNGFSLTQNSQFGYAADSVIVLDFRDCTQSVSALIYDSVELAPTHRFRNVWFHFKNLQNMTGGKAVGLNWQSLQGSLQPCTWEVWDCLMTAENIAGSSAVFVGAYNSPAVLRNLAIGPSIAGRANAANPYGCANAENLIELSCDGPVGYFVPYALAGEGIAGSTRDLLGAARPNEPTVGPIELAAVFDDPELLFDRSLRLDRKLPTRSTIAGTDEATGDVAEDVATALAGDLSAITTSAGSAAADTQAIIETLGTPEGDSLADDIAGIEGGGGVPKNVMLMRVPGSRTITVGTFRDDQESDVSAPIRMKAGAKLPWKISFARTQLSLGDLIDGVSSPVVSGDDAAKCIIDETEGVGWGVSAVDGEGVVLVVEIDDSATPGDDIAITLVVEPEEGMLLPITIPVEVIP